MSKKPTQDKTSSPKFFQSSGGGVGKLLEKFGKEAKRLRENSESNRKYGPRQKEKLRQWVVAVLELYDSPKEEWAPRKAEKWINEVIQSAGKSKFTKAEQARIRKVVIPELTQSWQRNSSLPMSGGATAKMLIDDALELWPYFKPERFISANGRTGLLPELVEHGEIEVENLGLDYSAGRTTPVYRVPAKLKNNTDLQVGLIDVMESHATPVYVEDTAPEQTTSYSIAELRVMTGLANTSINKYAKLAGVATPERGKRDFRYPLSGARLILKAIIDNTSEKTTRERCLKALSNLPEIAKKSQINLK